MANKTKKAEKTAAATVEKTEKTQTTVMSKKRKILITALVCLMTVCLAVGVVLPIALLTKQDDGKNNNGGYGQTGDGIDDDEFWTDMY